jgi:two-component system chemotaxis response regulator CheY
MPRILVIDDEEDIRSTVKSHLAKENYEVIEANDGGEAIRKIFADGDPLRIDAIICDIRMPKIYGMDAISYFQMKYADLPLIIIAGSQDSQMALNFLKKGVKGYIAKPINRDSLLTAVKKIISEKEQ